jgi:MscS family membrane protein
MAHRRGLRGRLPWAVKYSNRHLIGLALCLLTAGISPPAYAQDGAQENGAEAAGGQVLPEPPAPINERFESPRATMLSYLAAMADVGNAALSSREHTQARREATECFDWGAAGESSFNNASMLIEVLNKIGAVERMQLPGRSEVTARGLDEFVYFPQDRFANHARVRRDALGGTIEFTKTATGEWKFSIETIDGVQTLRNALEPLPFVTGEGPLVLTRAQWIRSRVPISLKGGGILTLEYWQWLGLGLLIFIGVVLDTIARGLIAGTWRHVMARRGREADRALLRRAVRPFGLIVAAVVWYWGLDLIGLPVQALYIIRLAVRFFLMISSVWAAWRATDLLAEFLRSKAELSATKFDDLLIPLVRKTAKLLITALGLVYIANALRIEILPLLTGLGIGGIAFAFAAKDTIENFFGSVAVMFDRPFEVGDWVVIDEVEGTIEDLGFRSTRIRTFYNSLVTVPNSTLVRAKVDNYGRRRYRRYKTHLAITYGTRPDTIEAFCEGIRELIRQHPYARKDYFHVWLNKFGASSLDVLVYMFHDAPDWATELRERQRFMLDIMRLAEHLGVEFAFPTQTLHIESGGFPGASGAGLGEAGVGGAGTGAVGVSPATEPAPDRLAEQRARVQGRRAARRLLANVPWSEGEVPEPVSFGEDAIPDDIPVRPEDLEEEPADSRDAENSEDSR